jgi:hypothetical protein
LNRSIRAIAPAACAIALVTSASPALAVVTQFFGPTPYLSFADSPFKNLPFEYFYLETFEDGQANTKGLSVGRANVQNPGSNTDSVDGDDGWIDGSGTDGRSLAWSSGLSGIICTFDEVALGQLPTHVGIVWTDGRDDVHFQAYDRNHVLIGSLVGASSDGLTIGYTAEDRFYGVEHSAGIGSILIQAGMPSAGGNIEVDHVQYGVQTGLVDVGGGSGALAMAPGMPNPFRDHCAIGYTLPEGGGERDAHRGRRERTHGSPASRWPARRGLAHGALGRGERPRERCARRLVLRAAWVHRPADQPKNHPHPVVERTDSGPLSG